MRRKHLSWSTMCLIFLQLDNPEQSLVCRPSLSQRSLRKESGYEEVLVEGGGERERRVQMFLISLCWHLLYKAIPGAHYQERLTTAPYSRHGVFTDRLIFRLNFPRILDSRRAPMSSHNKGEHNKLHHHKFWFLKQNKMKVKHFFINMVIINNIPCHPLCSYKTTEKHFSMRVFDPLLISSPYFTNSLKINWSVKMPWHRLSMGVGRSW